MVGFLHCLDVFGQKGKISYRIAPALSISSVKAGHGEWWMVESER
jgi:hypothetical protein